MYKSYWWKRILNIENLLEKEPQYTNKYKHLLNVLDSLIYKYNNAEEDQIDIILEKCFNCPELMKIVFEIYNKLNEEELERKLKKLILVATVKNILIKE